MCDGDGDLDTILSLISTKINKIFYDREFVGCVKEDLDIILKNDKHCVVFPKLKPIFLKVLRYQAVIFDLSVFCIGTGPNQVVVVCKKISKEPTDECQSISTQKKSKGMDAEEKSTKSTSKKSRIRPTQSYYVPPAQRSVTKKKKGKEDAVKALQKLPTKETTKKSEQVLCLCSKSEQVNSEMPISHDVALVNSSSESVNSSQIIDTHIISDKSERDNSTDQSNISDMSQTMELPGCTINIKLVQTRDSSSKYSSSEELPASSTLIDELSELPPNLETNANLSNEPADEIISDFRIVHHISCANKANELDSDNKLEKIHATSLENIAFVGPVPTHENTTIINQIPFIKEKIVVSQHVPVETQFSQLYISYNDELKKKPTDCDTDNEKEEMQRAMENISRKRRPLIKHVHNDGTLWTNGNKPVSQQITNLAENEKNNKTYDHEQGSNEEDQNNLANWEDMFDENGELHSDYIGEILKQIGCEVKVVKASHDYSAYENTKYQDLEHVIELYDFPSTLRTQDIMQLYRGASEKQMYVKWCDDTHCLLVLSTPAQAQRALQIEHEIIKSRPLSQASTIAASTASSTDLKPAMKRPQTNMQTARRLITTHLGTKSSLSKEEVEQERQALRDAREQRRLERQNEKDAWEGRPRNAKS